MCQHHQYLLSTRTVTHDLLVLFDRLRQGCCDACRAVEAAAESASDVVGRAFWWSNCIQLRWMLWAMSHGGSLDSEYGQELGGSVDDFDWVMQVILGLSALPAGYPGSPRPLGQHQAHAVLQ